MLITYKTEINPTVEQKIKINKTIGVCRYLYNKYIDINSKIYKSMKDLGLSYMRCFVSGYDFDKWVNNIHSKEPGKEWIKDVSSKARKQSIMNAEKAFKNFFKDSKHVGFPKFKKKRDQNVKMYLPKNNKTDFRVERHRINIPTLGYVRLKEYGYIPTNGIVKSGTIGMKAGKYYISVLVEEYTKQSSIQNTNLGIGVDLGLKEFAIASNGNRYKNVNKTVKVRKLEKRLKRSQRKLSRKHEFKKKRGGTALKNMGKQVLRVQKLHCRLSNIRSEYVSIVADNLVKSKPEFITIEDLNVRGMMKNRHLSKAISHQHFYKFRTILESKCKKHRIELRVANRFYASSKTCNICGNIKKDLKLSDRVYRCDKCGYTIDRDLGASINLAEAKEYTVIT